MDSYHISLVVVGIGFLFAVAGSLLIFIKAIQTNVVWGLVAFFVPFGKLVFACVHWAEAKIGVLPLVIGWIMVACGAPGIPYMKNLLPSWYHVPSEAMASVAAKLPWVTSQPPSPTAQSPSTTPQNKPADLNSQVQEHRQRLESLQGFFAQDGAEIAKEYQALGAQRKALKTGDTEAITKFNEAAAAYQARNTARKQMQQEIDTTQRELDDLLDARARAAAPHAPHATGTGGGVGGKAKNVVMYTTSHCPACKAAKQYLAQKGVPYQEIDVETSRDGLAAFQKLGGHGVPLILVGDKRMEGFSPQALDAAL
jgi:glutaredoxin